MRYVCDAPGGRIWFSMETEAEADAESELMGHAVAKYFRRAVEGARMTYRPREGLASFERDIGLKDHIVKRSPIFLTLRDGEGKGLATAMLSRKGPGGGPLIERGKAIIVGPGNADPWPDHADAIAALGAHLGVKLDRGACYPYA